MKTRTTLLPLRCGRTFPGAALAALLFFLAFLRDAKQVLAQEKPRYTMPLFSTNATVRQDICDHHNAQFAGGSQIELRNALVGMEIRPLLGVGQYFALTDEGAIDEENPGLLATLLDELALRGGFTWRNSYGIAYNDATTTEEGRTWTDVLDWATENYDVAVDWWMITTERMSLGIAYPEGWYDSSIILVGLGSSDSNDLDFWAWLAPFDTTLWLLLLATLVASGVVFWSLEQLEPSRRKKRLGERKFSLQSIFLSMITFTGHLQFLPRTDASRIFTFSLAFFSLLTMSAYTANLASFLVLRNKPSVHIRSVGDAVKADYRICVWAGSSMETILKKAYPTAEFPTYSGEPDCFAAMRRGECKFVGTTVSSMQAYKNNREVNFDCQLEWIGRVFKFVPAGFATRADSGIKCTNLIRDVLDIHLKEMKAEGIIDQAWDEHLEKSASIKCESRDDLDEPESLPQLTIKNMSGLFTFHAILSSAAMLWAVVYRQVHRKKAAEIAAGSADDMGSLRNRGQSPKPEMLEEGIDDHDDLVDICLQQHELLDEINKHIIELHVSMEETRSGHKGLQRLRDLSARNLQCSDSSPTDDGTARRATLALAWGRKNLRFSDNLPSDDVMAHRTTLAAPKVHRSAVTNGDTDSLSSSMKYVPWLRT